MKRFFFIILVAFFMAGTAFNVSAQQDDTATPQITLESFEMCNNWARHYCRRGNHEDMVNHILLGMKQRGLTITTAIIKSVSRRTLKNTAPPSAPVQE